MDELVARISKVPLAQRALVLGLAIVVILVATYLFFISPLNSEITQLQRRDSQLDTQLAQKRRIARNLSRHRVDVERLKQRLNEALTELPNEAEIPELLQKVAALVEQSDCKMAIFQPQGEIIEKWYARIPVEMGIEGNYHAIAVFFDKVSQLARIVNVTDIELRQPTVQNNKVVLSASFLATTFKFVEGRKEGKVGSGTGFGAQR